MAQGYFADDQLTTPLTEAVESSGNYPAAGSGAASDALIGLVRTFAGNFAPGGYLADGQALTIASEQTLYSVIGNAFGGDGVRTFALPDLQGVVPVGLSSNQPLGVIAGSDTAAVSGAQFPTVLGGTSQPVALGQPTQAISYLICTSGQFPSSDGQPSGAFLGEVMPFLGGVVPAGFSLANGAVLSINRNQALFSLLGTTYGGDGISTFALPNLQGRDIVGTGPSLALGTVVGQTSVTLTKAELPAANGGNGTTFNDQRPGLALHYIIAMEGVYPSRDGTTLVDQPYIGEVRAFAGSIVPGGWALADGRLLPIQSYTTLFSVLGTQFGGDGRTTFSLPNLINSAVSGTGNRAGSAYSDGAQFGSDNAALVVTNATPCYCPGTLILTAEGERPVEVLAIGDLVVTASGERRPIRWIGRRSYAGRFLAGNRAAHPIRIRAGALGDGLPRRDLLVSSDHALFLDGLLIPARCLLNGTTVTRERPDRVDYVHVELDSYDILLAEGAPAESFIDDDSRSLFHNAAEYARRYPGAPPTAGFCAPRAEDGFGVEAVRSRLAALAQAA